MCGILGWISGNKKVDKDEFEAMLDQLEHRGPDADGTYFGDGISLGSRRLSIVSLNESGNQPIWDSTGETSIIYNGEVYNYLKLKKEIKGVKFKSETDTEVILHMYKKYGIKDTLSKLNGMFAFCIYDKKENKAIIARDRVGVKPLVYYQSKNNFIFASEIKAIRRAEEIDPGINPKAVYDFFIHRYVPNPRTIYQNIYKLEPGHYIELDVNTLKYEKNEYWRLRPNRNKNMGEEEAAGQIERLLKDSVQKRLIADVEVASLLSGGVDSSTVTALAQEYKPNIRAFSIDIQPEQFSEVEHAKRVSNSRDINLNTKKVGKEEFAKSFEEIIQSCDEPFADSSIIPTYLLCEYVSQNGIKTALSGDGGDEVFYGYRWFDRFYTVDESSLNFLSKLLPTRLLEICKSNPIIKFLFFLSFKSVERYRRIMFDRFTTKEIESIFNFSLGLENDYMYKEKTGKEKINWKDVNVIDFKTFLVDDILYKVDTAAMANCLEVRVPYLDHRLVETVFSISISLLYKKVRKQYLLKKHNNREKKYILKRIAEKYIPKENIYRSKKGFSAPVMGWVSSNLKEYITSSSLSDSDILDSKKLEEFVQSERNEGKLWQLFIFSKWYEYKFTSSK
jgi:asparagine synthase (glutamine-hydrolysing)